MLLKRSYDTPEGWEPEVNTYDDGGKLRDPRKPAGAVLNRPNVTGVAVIHTGTHAEQNFSRRKIDEGLAEGWLTLSRGQIIIETAQGDLDYTILRTPGLYCCHCDEALGDDPSGLVGREHVAAQHAGVVSPDAQNPSGYRRVNGYECVLDEAQHAKWKVPEYATVSHSRHREGQ